MGFRFGGLFPGLDENLPRSPWSRAPPDIGARTATVYGTVVVRLSISLYNVTDVPWLRGRC